MKAECITLRSMRPGHIMTLNNPKGEKASLYADMRLTIPVCNPIVADMNGDFPTVWIDTDVDGFFDR